MRSLLLSCFFILFFGCVSKNPNSQATLWTQRMCCDQSGFLLVNELRIDYQRNVEISFCEKIDSVIRLSLFTISDNQQKTLFDLLGALPLENQKLLIKINEKPIDARGVFNFNDKLYDGDYYLFVATNKSCGEMRFNLSNGKKTKEILNCIKYCDDMFEN